MMKIRKICLILVFALFPFFLHAQDFFISASASVGAVLGPDFIDTDETSHSIGGELYFGRLLFFGLDFSMNDIVFSDTKTFSGATGEFYIFDGVSGLSLNLGLARYFIGAGAGGYLCNYTGTSNDPDFGGFALNLFTAGYLKLYDTFNIGLNYKLYGLFGAGWYNTFGVFVCFSLEDF